ncbi:MAG: cereblon family protein [Desulfosarcina sp.]
MHPPFSAIGVQHAPSSEPSGNPVWCRSGVRPERRGHDPGTAPQALESSASSDSIVCRQCLHEITSASERRQINGGHSHIFANPQGIVFEIVCYRHAWGCVCVGHASAEFTWFAGCEWRIAICAACRVHLGWRFSGADGAFFHGLIGARLMLRETGADGR